MVDMSSVEAPDWMGIVQIMEHLSTRLPVDWDLTDDFWIGGIQNLAEIVISLRAKVPEDDLAVLVGIGGMMAAQARKEQGARNLTDALFAGLKDGGAA